jgi:uracil-DNA glycosylase
MAELFDRLPATWQLALQSEFQHGYMTRLQAFLAAERAQHEVFPPASQVFRALELTPFDQVRVVILGQDPYHDAGQAHGLAFSVPPGVKPPPSLVNIFKELESDIGLPRPKSGVLEPWARQGVLLLNTVLTVRAHKANSHQKQGWERLTDAMISAVAAQLEPVVFVLWGANAHKKAALIETDRHTILKSAHPSPLSARTGFFGSKPFSAINKALTASDQPPINWALD